MERLQARVWLAAFAAASLVVPAWAGAPPAGPRGVSSIRTHEGEVRPDPAARFDPGRVLVKYREGAAKRPEDREAVRALAGAALLRTYSQLPNLEALRVGAGSTVAATIAALASDPRVEYAEPDYVCEALAVPNDEHFDVEWGLNNTGQPVDGYPGAEPDFDVNAPEAWDRVTGDGTAVVAILDEGIDVTHPDLRANVWVNDREVPANGVDDDGNGFVDDVNGWDFRHDDATVFDNSGSPTDPTDSHGTHVAGTVGAVGNNGIGVSGVCWNVKLMSLKFLDHTGDTSDAIDALNYAVMMKGRGVNLRAVNASWGGGAFSAALQEAIAAAGASDILFVAAAGNGGGDQIGDDNDAAPLYPACYEVSNVISVGAWTRYNARAVYSNFGATTVDLYAPGSIVASTGPNGIYFYDSGTSMAAPHVTGAAALAAMIAPKLTAAEIKQVLMESTVVVSGLTSVTNGRLDLAKVVVDAYERGGEDGGDPGGGDPGGGDPGDPADPPVLESVRFSQKKKTLYVVGQEFHQDTTIVEVDGVALPVTLYPTQYQLPDGTFAQIEGKAPGRINFFLPKHKTVQVTVYDTATQLRSAPIPFKR